MLIVDQIIAINNLQQADVIVLKKKFFGMIDHFAVFLGWSAETGLPLFAANYTKGTQLIEQLELEKFLQTLEPQRIERFTGDQYERQSAVKRALSEIGKNEYNYFTNNCEHYKNFVQTGRRFSSQSDNAGNALAAGGAFVLVVGLLNELFDQR